MKNYLKAVVIILVCLAVLIPLASSDPDGLEQVAETLGIEETEPASSGIMPDYTVPGIQNEYGSTLIAGVFGIFLVLGLTILVGKAIKV
jgi:cobalt/nickel transport protein